APPRPLPGPWPRPRSADRIRDEPEDVDVGLDRLHAEAHDEPVIDGGPETLDVSDEIAGGRGDRPGLQGGEIGDVPFAEVGHQTAELLRASPMVVSPQVLRELVVPISFRREPR